MSKEERTKKNLHTNGIWWDGVLWISIRSMCYIGRHLCAWGYAGTQHWLFGNWKWVWVMNHMQIFESRLSCRIILLPRGFTFLLQFGILLCVCFFLLWLDNDSKNINSYTRTIFAKLPTDINQREKFYNGYFSY